jgi:hypothetical protein
MGNAMRAWKYWRNGAEKTVSKQRIAMRKQIYGWDRSDVRVKYGRRALIIFAALLKM